MKKIVFRLALVLSVAVAAIAYAAQTSAVNMMNLGMPAELANYISTALVQVNSSGNLVLPVASGKKLSVTVAGTEVASVSSAGLGTFATGVTATAGDFISGTSGGTLSIQEATAGAKCLGTVTGTGTTAITIATTCATTGSRILIARSSAPSGTAQCWATNIVAATSFDFDCDGAETGTFAWFILHESA